ncbi:MAG: biopolymer transporter ExbD [Kofleriaceae bacterium]
MQFGSGKSAKQAQHDTMNEFAPTRLVADATWKGEITKRKIRVYADSQYRTQNVRWQKSFDKPLEIANIILTRMFGLELVPEYTPWDRHSPGSTLDDDLKALQAMDSGTDVFAVIGLTSSLTLVSATFDEIGYATVGGRHIMLRGYADLAERKMYANAFSDLRADEREDALGARREHKTAVVLLHELGHNLAMGHANETDVIMSGTYSIRAAGFNGEARDFLMAAIDRRLGRTSEAPAVATQTAATTTVAAPATPKAPVVHHAPIIIRVTKAGGVVIAGKPIDAAALDALLGEAAGQDPETEIVIHNDKNPPVGAVGGVIDRAKAAGLSKFSFGTTGL